MKREQIPMFNMFYLYGFVRWTKYIWWARIIIICSFISFWSLQLNEFLQWEIKQKLPFPTDTGRKLNVHKTFRRRPGRLLNVLCTLNLHPVSTWSVQKICMSAISDKKIISIFCVSGVLCSPTLSAVQVK